ncbi:hypothetical protein ASA1KI_02220 [Opitutales bacterium ASA1]|uniref:hypothetical protein n=1 Tax=Congregicoccus parvus TaxID=3081749 RepID=UPI002B2F9709|nr:hypothetical protein ASA1KI_02220 [Opitutales bacterium ASA1]
MNRRVRRLAFAALLLATAASTGPAHAEPSGDLLAYLHRKQFEMPVNADTHEYYILMADENTVGDLLEFLREPADERLERLALIALSAVGAVDKSSVGWEQWADVITRLESSYDPRNADSSSLMQMAYWGVAQYGTEDSLQFLIERSEAETWRGGPMPLDRTRVYSDETVAIVTPATLAVMALCWDGSPGSLRYRDEYLERNRPSEDPAVQYARKRLESARFSLSSGRRIQEAAWALKQRGFRLDEYGRFVPLDDEDVQSQASAASSEQSEAPVHEPTQTAPSDGATVDTRRTNRRLPVLAGAVLALAAIAWLALRRRGT